jgi:hypothetical protein
MPAGLCCDGQGRNRVVFARMCHWDEGNLNRGPRRGQGTWWPSQSGNSADRPVCRNLYWAAAGVCDSAAGANCAANFAKN